MLRAVVVVAAVLLSGCSGNSTGPNARGVANVSMAPESLSIAIGDSALIRAQPIDAAGAPIGDASLFWSTSDSTIASVDQLGMIHAIGIGSVNIDASTAGVSPKHPARVVVIATPVASIIIAPGTVTMHVGDALQLADTARDAAGHPLTGRPVSWTSSDSTVAMVDQAGLVLAKSKGSATITATSGSAHATASVTVVPVAQGPPAVAAVTVTPATAIINHSNDNSSVQLTATLLDARGNTIVGPSITWSSSNRHVAVVSSTGIVTPASGGSHGKATITATSEGKQGTAAVTVTRGDGGD